MRLGVFGGTFDPIHNVHLFVAESARRLQRLDRVLFVPTGKTHYRPSAQTAAEERTAMIDSAIATNDAFVLDDTDLSAGASGYTADLLLRLHERYPGSSLTFICGADALAENRWERLDDVMSALEAFVIAPRAGVGADRIEHALASLPTDLRARVKMLDLPQMPESATLVRALLREGRSVRYLVPEPVWRHIVSRGLYGVCDE